MKNKAINTLKYTGIVTLSQYIGNKKVKIAQFHNTGGSSLFDFLSDCLIGEELNTLQAKRPRKVRLLHYTKSDNVYTSFEPASGFIFLLEAKKLDTATGSCVRYSFLIHRDMLEALGDLGNLGLGLYASSATDLDISDFTAFCELDVSRGNLVSSSLVVDWDLIITNSGANPYSMNT